jgi:ATP-dependent Clp protease adaptor protein ClpS
MTISPTIEKQNTTSDKIRVPKKYKVVVCNDDVTPVEFVISMLMLIFKHDEKTAYDLTYKIHHTGSAVAGIYSFEIAEQKGLDATNLSRDNGYPLIIKIEPE